MCYIIGKFHSAIKENKIQYIPYLFHISCCVSCRCFGHLSRIQAM